MTGQELIDWIRDNKAEEANIYVEVRPKLFKITEAVEIIGSDECPCMDMIVIR